MLTRANIERYFLAEKQESLLFLIIGIIAILFALIAIAFLRTSFWKGAALPLIVVGIIQIVVGYTIYTRSDEDRIRNVYAYDSNPAELKQKELPRMQKVNKSFVLYRYIQLILLVIGLVLLLKFKQPLNNSTTWGGYNFWLGIGIFLALQSAIMLAADFFAEKRALHYTKLLTEFVNQK